jgi:hypothetical protein
MASMTPRLASPATSGVGRCTGVGEGPLYEFATAREVAEFFVPRVGHRFGCWVNAAYDKLTR